MKKLTMALSLLVLMGCQNNSKTTSDDVLRAEFNADDTVNIPKNYRNWSHIGTRINVVGHNIIDGKAIEQPEILNAYVEPRALKIFQQHGEWPDGTQIVKEFSSVLVGDNCSTINFSCNTDIGNAIFQNQYTGLGMMVKDKIRFSSKPGNWGYFDFGHHPEPYNQTSKLRPDEQCSACHEGGAKESDYVFARAHLRLVSEN